MKSKDVSNNVSYMVNAPLISKGNSMEIRLRKDVFTQLKKVTKANSPNLFAMLASAEGYLGVEKLVLQRVLATHLVPEAIIPHIEQELDMIG